MYLNKNSFSEAALTSGSPIFPEPPKHLVERDYLVQHLPAEKIPVDYTKINQILNDRREAEISYANIYTEKLSVEEFNNKLLRKIHAFARYKTRVRRLYENLKGMDGSVSVMSKMLQKDLFIAERSLENIQIENQAFLGTIQNYEEKENELIARLHATEQDLEQLKFQFQSLAEKFDEKNKMLELAEERFQNLLLQLEKTSAAATKNSEQLLSTQEEITVFKNQITASQLRENSLAQLNSELAETLTKLQKKNKDLELSIHVERKEFESKLKYLQNTKDLLQENEDAESQNLLDRVSRFSPALDGLSDHDWQIKKVTNDELLAEAYPSLGKLPSQISSEDPSPAVDSGSKNIKVFYERWSHIIDQLSSLSGPLREPADDSHSDIKSLVDFKGLDTKEEPKSSAVANPHVELGI